MECDKESNADFNARPGRQHKQISDFREETAGQLHRCDRERHVCLIELFGVSVEEIQH